MPLSPPAARDELHTRRIEIRGYRRSDGLYDVEGRIVDTKPGGLHLTSSGKQLAPGDPLHEMHVRLTFDEELRLHDAEAATVASPHRMCPEAAPAIHKLKGLTITGGFMRAVRERVGGEKGCTHINELLAQMATTAMQTLTAVRNKRPATLDAHGKPVKIDTCYAWGAGQDLVRVRWPQHYTGPQKPQDAKASP